MSEGTPDLSGLLGNLLSNPSLLSSLGNLLGGLKSSPPPDGCEPPREPPCEEECPAFAPPTKEACASHSKTCPPFLPPCPVKKPPYYEKDPRLCLLLALRPFLSCKRQSMLDGLLRIFEVLDLVDRMNGGNYV